MNPFEIFIRSDTVLDAPLDESNINRFIRVLQRFIDHSQFIVITHNQRTIGMADVLYGVTMEEHGISKIVSVKFHKATEPLTETGTTPLEPPWLRPWTPRKTRRTNRTRRWRLLWWQAQRPVRQERARPRPFEPSEVIPGNDGKTQALTGASEPA